MSGQEPVLTYFSGRGFSEIIRLTFTAAGVTFKEVNTTKRQDFVNLLDSGLLTFREIPLLQIDGIHIVQSNSIVRYLARKYGFFGDTIQEGAQIDSLYEGTRNVYQFYYMGITEENNKRYLAKMKDVLFPKYFPIFNKLTQDSKSGYLVGSHLSLADLGLLEVLLSAVDYFGDDILKDYAGLKAFYGRMLSLDNIQKYMKEIRRPMNDDRYVKTVQTVLLWPENLHELQLP